MKTAHEILTQELGDLEKDLNIIQFKSIIAAMKEYAAQYKSVDGAKNTLEKEGYLVDELWSIRDIDENNDTGLTFSKREKMQILQKSVNCGSIISEINTNIITNIEELSNNLSE